MVGPIKFRGNGIVNFSLIQLAIYYRSTILLKRGLVWIMTWCNRREARQSVNVQEFQRWGKACADWRHSDAFEAQTCLVMGVDPGND